MKEKRREKNFHKGKNMAQKPISMRSAVLTGHCVTVRLPASNAVEYPFGSMLDQGFGSTYHICIHKWSHACVCNSNG